MSILSPDQAMAQAFLDILGPNEQFTFQTFDDNADRKEPSLARVFHGSLQQHFATLARLQQRGAGVYVMVNRGDGVIHPGAKSCRTHANVTAIRSLFVDLDGAPLEPVLQSLSPDMVVLSSPGRWHAYWLTNDCPIAEFGPRQQQIAEKFRGDPKVFDLPRVMRLPGFFHQKKEPYMTQMIYPE